MRFTRAVFAVALALQGFVLQGTASAQPGATGTIIGVVTTANGQNIGAADVSATGPTNARGQTSSDGKFSISGLTPGIYTISVSKASFQPAATTDVTVLDGQTVTLNITLQPASFSQLTTIATVSTSSKTSMNTSTASVTNVSGQVFVDQGLQQVTAVLNQIPGLITTIPASSTQVSGANANTPQIPQIRGALPYETESLIDGHPVSVGANGYFTPLFLNPNQLQEVEVAKGPGSMPTDISYAVGGTVNYITLAPTRTPQSSISFDEDSYGGLSTNARATGSLFDHLVGYAFAYGIDGTPGPLHNFAPVQGVPIDAITGTGVTANGVPICGTPAAGTSCLEGQSPAPSGYYATFSPTYAITTCCYKLSSQYQTRSELAKLQFNFSTQSSLTLAFLGAQSSSANEQNYSDPLQLFVPPAGYTGGIPSGASLPFATDTGSEWQDYVTQGILESEFRTSVGPASVLLRYYTGANNNNLYIGNSSATVPSTFTMDTWGGLPIGPGGTEEFFNGQPVSYVAPQPGLVIVNLDHFSGMSGEVDVPVGTSTLTFSADHTSHNSYSGYTFPTFFINVIPDGASQSLNTYLAKGQFTINPQLSATLANYIVSYQTHYTPDGGVTWANTGHNLDLPRLAFAYRAGANTSVRLSAGSSFAPPYLALVNTQSGPPQPNIEGAPNYYTQIANTGQISPETAFGYDLGFDRRLASDTILSADAYMTNLHGQFLTQTIADGTFTGTGQNAGLTAPLYIQSTTNLGESRYEGVEFSVHKSPNVGFGYTLNGSLMRAFAFNLPPGFYNTAAGPFTTNLGVIPNINFQPSGEAYNGSSSGGRVPYSTGYGELNYRTSSGSLFLIGAQYNGNNNSYNLPAFVTVNASARVQLTKTMSLQGSIANLTALHTDPYFGLLNGIPVPLANGQFGATPAINLGPTTFHIVLTQKFGH